MSSPTWLGIQAIFPLFEEEIHPGFPQSLWITLVLLFRTLSLSFRTWWGNKSSWKWDYYCHPWDILSGIKSNLSSPTWLGIQTFFPLFEEEIHPGFPLSLWMTNRSREWHLPPVNLWEYIINMVCKDPIFIILIKNWSGSSIKDFEDDKVLSFRTWWGNKSSEANR